jgi:hypothetical protein
MAVQAWTSVELEDSLLQRASSAWRVSGDLEPPRLFASVQGLSVAAGCDDNGGGTTDGSRSRV